MRVTVIASNVYTEFGISAPVGSTITVGDDYGASLVRSLKATDTDGVLSMPGNRPFDQVPPQSPVSGGSALPAAAEWSTTWDTAAYKDIGSYIVAGALALTSTDAASVRGGCTQAVIVANGVNVPTLDGVAATVYGYINTAGALNLIQLYRAGDAKFWSCGAYAGTALSTPTAPSWPAAPTIGAAVVGSVVTVTGAATGTAPITYSYQWTLDGADIGGAVSSTYTPVAGDAGHLLRVRVTATNAISSAASTSDAVTVSVAGVAPVWSAAPGLASAVVGSAVSITAGTVAGSAPITYGYQWKLDGAAISGATSATYTPVAGDATHALTCTVTASNMAGSAGSTTNAVTVVAAATTINAQLTTVIGLTQSGDATAGWNYTPTAANTGFSGSNGGVSTLKIPSGAGGYFQCKLSGWSSGNAFHIGLKTTSATGSYNTTACGLYGRSTNVYNVSTGATGSVTPSGGALAVADGDMMRVGRDADGTTCWAYKSSDNGATWTLMHTWTGISGNLYCLLNFGGAGVSALDVEGFGVS